MMENSSQTQIIYARYNRHRRPPFQTATLIAREGQRQYIIKQALGPEARDHLAHLRQTQQLLAQHRAIPEAAFPALLEDRCGPDTLAFEYIDAPSMDQILWQAWRNGDKPAFIKILDEYRRLLTDAFGTQPQPVITPELRAIFGDDPTARLSVCGPCSGLAFIDPVFENILCRDNTRFFIDNEWVAPGALPVDFALYRALYYFFKVKYSQHHIEDFISLDEVLSHFKIAQSDTEVYLAMDERFQAYVFGEDRQAASLDRYAHPAYLTVASLQETISRQRETINYFRSRLTAIVNTPGWRMLEKLRHLHAKLAPAGTWRARVWEAVWGRLWKARS